MITPEQVYYVTRVYPERVTLEEARESWDEAELSDDDKSLFTAQANVLNAIARN